MRVKERDKEVHESTQLARHEAMEGDAELFMMPIMVFVPIDQLDEAEEDDKVLQSSQACEYRR